MQAEKNGLPVIAPAKNLLTGTYVAEQLSTESYDLVAATSPHALSRSRAPTAGPASKTPRRRGASQRYQGPKYSTVLPALATLDPIFSQGRTAPQAGEEEQTLPQQRRSLALHFDSKSGPSDDLFQEWISLPKKNKLTPLQQRSRATKGIGTDSPLSTPLSKRNESWHVVLLRKTFDDADNTPEYVESCLEHDLGFDSAAAKQKVEDSQRRALVVVDVSSTIAEAFQKAQSLRSRGLVAQVASTAGLPSNEEAAKKQHRPAEDLEKASDKGSPESPRRRCYTDVFDGILRKGEITKKSPRNMSQPNADKGNSSKRFTDALLWRKAEVADIDVVPEDPVTALLNPDGGHHVTKLQSTASRTRKDLRRATTRQMTIGMQDGGQDAGNKKNEQGDGGLNSVIEAVLPKQPITPLRKEACQMFRHFVFGQVGNEHAKSGREREYIYYETIGSREQVRLLCQLWQRLDADKSGRVDIVEFRTLAEQYIRDGTRFDPSDPGPGSGWNLGPTGSMWNNGATQEDPSKAVQKLSEKLAQVLLGKKSSILIDDMMRILWPCASLSDIKKMNQWCKEFLETSGRLRVNPPPVLSKAEFDGLCAVFRYFDEDCSGALTFEELASKGLIYEEDVVHCINQWDRSGNGKLELLEFCDMMCPSGYRACESATIGTQYDGTRVILDPKIDGWRVDSGDVETDR